MGTTDALFIYSTVQELESFSKEVYKLKELKRYNNTPKIHQESVAEHSYFVALLIVKLREYIEFDLPTALIMAIVHDLPEVQTSDIPFNVKQRFNNISPTIEQELDVIDQMLGKEYKDIHSRYTKRECIESMIVKLADVLSCKQYSNSERSLGNKSMDSIYYECSDAIKRMLIKIINKKEANNA